MLRKDWMNVYFGLDSLLKVGTVLMFALRDIY